MNRHPWKKSSSQMTLNSGAVDPQQELIDEASRLGQADFFPTPAWCTEGLIEVAPPPREDIDVVFEPAAGSGAMVRCFLARGYRVCALEIRPRAIPALRDLCPTEWGSFLRPTPAIVELVGGSFDHVAIATNPPFALAHDFVITALETMSPWVAMLLRVNVIASRPWGDVFCRWGRQVRERGDVTPPTAIANLRKRPSFSGDGKTSMDNYAWFIWEVGEVPIDFRPIG